MEKPNQIKIRAYQVGFGDCFLLTFCYPKGGDRHVLIDFGSTSLPEGAGSSYMRDVANSIKKECKGALHAVILSHRHGDHLSGFQTTKAKTGPGDIIAGCKPEVVVQPWTEHPDAAPEATSAPGLSTPSKAFVGSLRAMERVAAATVVEAKRMKDMALSETLRGQLGFLGETGTANPSAVRNLMTMAANRFYLSYGSKKTGLEAILPGVKVHVIGPPTLEQSEAIRKERAVDPAEYWHIQALASELAAGAARPPFPGAAVVGEQDRPSWTRWLIRRMQQSRGEQLLEIVRVLDDAMNNTSLVLLFEVGKQLLLFPGDAQIENWEYALAEAKRNPKLRELLESVTVYKVGHHGSLNATPKTLWGLFKNKGGVAPAQLLSLLSTKKGKHGDPDKNTEVPRRTLVAELKSKSRLVSTESVPAKALFWSEVFET